MTTVEIKMLQRWRVDREDGMTASGPEKLAILILKPLHAPEVAIAMSKVDAMAIGIQLQLAAADAQGS